MNMHLGPTQPGRSQRQRNDPLIRAIDWIATRSDDA
jgi:hypothetical protein